MAHEAVHDGIQSTYTNLRELRSQGWDVVAPLVEPPSYSAIDPERPGWDTLHGQDRRTLEGS